MNDWTDKINVENGDNVYAMENDGDTKEAEPSKARHLDKRKVKLRRVSACHEVSIDSMRLPRRDTYRDVEMLAPLGGFVGLGLEYSRGNISICFFASEVQTSSPSTKGFKGFKGYSSSKRLMFSLLMQKIRQLLAQLLTAGYHRQTFAINVTMFLPTSSLSDSVTCCSNQIINISYRYP